MKKIIEPVFQNERDYVKAGIKRIDGRAGICFHGDTCEIEFFEPYLKSDEWLLTKAGIKRAFDEFITAFREYQFNN